MGKEILMLVLELGTQRLKQKIEKYGPKLVKYSITGKKRYFLELAMLYQDPFKSFLDDIQKFIPRRKTEGYLERLLLEISCDFKATFSATERYISRVVNRSKKLKQYLYEIY